MAVEGASVVEEGDVEGCCCTRGGPLAEALRDEEGFRVATEDGFFIAGRSLEDMGEILA